MKVRKKPVVVEAVQWTGNYEKIKEFMVGKANWPRWRNDDVLEISTLEGVMEASLGDWIIQGVNGEFYPCKPDIFEKTYDSCEEEIIEQVPKDLGITKEKSAEDNIPDLVVYGDTDNFRLLCKASSQQQGWMKSTKVCNVDGGCIVQVTTQQRNPDGSYAVAEALTFVPGNGIDIESEPRRIVPMVPPFLRCFPV